MLRSRLSRRYTYWWQTIPPRAVHLARSRLSVGGRTESRCARSDAIVILIGTTIVAGSAGGGAGFVEAAMSGGGTSKCDRHAMPRALMSPQAIKRSRLILAPLSAGARVARVLCIAQIQPGGSHRECRSLEA